MSKRKKRTTNQQIIDAIAEVLMSDPEFVEEAIRRADEVVAHALTHARLNVRVIKLPADVDYYAVVDGKVYYTTKSRVDEFPEFTDDLDFFDAHTEIEG